MPFVGTRPRTKLMLMKACGTIKLVMPTARKRPKLSGVRRAARVPCQKKMANRMMTASAPTRPSAKSSFSRAC